jgi:hypothetical protein
MDFAFFLSVVLYFAGGGPGPGHAGYAADTSGVLSGARLAPADTSGVLSG